MKRIAAGLLVLGALLTGGCTQPTDVTVTPTTVVPTTSPGETSDVQGFTEAARANGLADSLENEKSLIALANSLCVLWDSGGTYQSAKDALVLSSEDKEMLIIMTGQYICPRHDGTYGG